MGVVNGCARNGNRMYVRDMRYRDDLPEDCPPGDAKMATDGQVVFRLLYGEVPTVEDFVSRWEMDRTRGRTTRVWEGGPTECELRGLSVFDTWEACEEQRRRERSRIGRIRLADGAGAMRRTHGHHFVLWPAAEFDILGHTTVEERR